MRQVGLVARDHAPAGETGRPHRRRARAVSGARSLAALRRADARNSRPRHRDDFPGTDDVAEPGADDRVSDHGAAADTPGHGRGRGARPRARAPEAGRHPRSGAPARPVSAPVFRRHAPARDDRDRLVVQSETADRRRAHDRARRDDPGADPEADERPLARARHRAGHHHAQSWAWSRVTPTAST